MFRHNLSNTFLTANHRNHHSYYDEKQDEKSLEKSENIANTISSGRLEIWETILANPADCILGKGFGTAVKEEKIGIGTNAHNSIVELLISVGIFATFFGSDYGIYYLKDIFGYANINIYYHVT